MSNNELYFSYYSSLTVNLIILNYFRIFWSLLISVSFIKNIMGIECIVFHIVFYYNLIIIILKPCKNFRFGMHMRTVLLKENKQITEEEV